MENAEISRKASDLRRIAYTSIRAEIADLVSDNSKTIVDVGCSNGALGNYLKLAQPDRTVFGVEVEPGFTKIASEKLEPDGSVVISLPDVRHISAFWSIFVWERFPRRDRGLFDRTHLRWFTYSDGKDILSAGGLTIETETMSLKWGDQGGGRLNRLLNRMPLMLKHFSPGREILAYQFCFRCRVIERNPSNPASRKDIPYAA